MKSFYTIDEVASLLNVTRSTISRYMKEGKIEYYKSGEKRTCRVLFKVSDIERFLQSCKVRKNEVNVAELSRQTGVSRQTLYTIKDKLGRFPTEQEVRQMVKK